MSEKEVKNKILDIIQNSRIAFLSTIDSNGFPVTRAVTNLRNKDLSQEYKANLGENSNFYFFSFTKSNKIEEIRLNNKNSIYFFNQESMSSVNIYGTAEAISNQVTRDSLWLDSFSHYFPLKSKDPNYMIIKFNPKFYRIVSARDGQKYSGKIIENDMDFIFR